jgi:hypothetical protein
MTFYIRLAFTSRLALRIKRGSLLYKIPTVGNRQQHGESAGDSLLLAVMKLACVESLS